MRKAVALLSGGLDSTLAVKLILEQAVEVEAVNFLTIFCTCTSRSSCRLEAKTASEKLGIPLKVSIGGSYSCCVSSDADVYPYVQHVKISWVEVELPKEVKRIRDLLNEVYVEYLKKLAKC